MSLNHFNFGSSDYLFIQIKDFLRQSFLVQNKPNSNAAFDESLRLSLTEFQKKKGLQITDGSLSAETFQAFGDEMNDGQLRSILFHNPKLKSLFISGKNSRKFALQPEVVMVPLNIVYDPKLLPSDSRGKDPLQFVKDSFKPKLDYWEETYRKLFLGYTVDFTIGEADDARNRITKGAKAGYANIFFLDDGYKHLGAYARTNPESLHIFISEQFNDKVYRRSLCHELGHVFGIRGWSEWAVLAISYNVITDLKINWALRQLKSDTVRYGVDWVDDYRNVYNSLMGVSRKYLHPKDYLKRLPTIYDTLRVGAMEISKK